MSKFSEGQTVESKIMSNKIGTVISVGDKGYVLVRFDGEMESVPVHESRLTAAHVSPTITPSQFEDQTYKRGDYIEVNTRDFGVVRGTAMNEWVRFGYASISILTDDGRLLDLNSNWDTHKVIFRADIARGHTPNY